MVPSPPPLFPLSPDDPPSHFLPVHKQWRRFPCLGFCAFTLRSHTPPLISLYPSGRLSPDAGSRYTSIGLRLQPPLRAAVLRSVSTTRLHTPPSSSVSLPLTSSPCPLYPSTPSVHADLGICHPNPPSLPTLPVLRYLPLPLSSPLSSLSITLSVIDGGAGRQPGKKVLRICPFRRLLPLSRPSCLSVCPPQEVLFLSVSMQAAPFSSITHSAVSPRFPCATRVAAMTP